MSHVPARLTDYLDASGVAYDVMRHMPEPCAHDTAVSTHTPDRQFAKTVFVRIDGAPAMAVLPADHLLSERRLRQSLGAHSVELMEESEMEELCPDCEVGAAPPVGHLYGIPLYLSPALEKEERVVFNAGTHEHVVRMRYADFAKLAQPRIAHMTRNE